MEEIWVRRYFRLSCPPFCQGRLACSSTSLIAVPSPFWTCQLIVSSQLQDLKHWQNQIFQAQVHLSRLNIFILWPFLPVCHTLLFRINSVKRKIIIIITDHYDGELQGIYQPLSFLVQLLQLGWEGININSWQKSSVLRCRKGPLSRWDSSIRQWSVWTVRIYQGLWAVCGESGGNLAMPLSLCNTS